MDLQAYLGKWFEIGRNNAPWENDCEHSTAEYWSIPWGLPGVVNGPAIGLLNRCFRGGVETRNIRGHAVPTEEAGVLNVRFDSGQTGVYRILYTDNVNYSIVGDPATGYISVLSRKAIPTSAEVGLISELLIRMGFTQITWTF